MILLARETIVFLLLETLLCVTLLVAAVGARGVRRGWNFQLATREQYARESRASLVELALVYALLGKLILLPWFWHLLDVLSQFVPGAMCGAGVLYSHELGVPLLSLKVFVPALAGFWLLVHREDLRGEEHPYLGLKMRLAETLAMLAAVEWVLDVTYLRGIPILTPVQCCAAIYGVAGSADVGDPLLSTPLLLALFGLLYLLHVVTGWWRYGLLHAVVNVGFLGIAYQAVVRFFGTYVYQLPTHHCPFCLLQREYGYYGYALWSTLLVGVFLGVAAPALAWTVGRTESRLYTGSRWLIGIFVLLCIAPVVLYRLRNGVWL